MKSITSLAKRYLIPLLLPSMTLSLIPLAIGLAVAPAVPAYAADLLSPLKSAVPLYAGFKGPPLEAAQRALSEVTGTAALTPKDFVTLDGYDEKLFSAFAKLPAARTQTADFTACSEAGAAPIYNRRITKGFASAIDYATDGFTAGEHAAIEKKDSRILHYVQVPTAKGSAAKGVTQYLDFVNASSMFPPKEEGINLRIGTLQNLSLPRLATTKCARLELANAVFPDEILRQAADSDEAVAMEDKNGMLWAVRKGPTTGKWVVSGPAHLSSAAAIKLFESSVARRSAAVQAPWHMSRTETFKGKKSTHLISFAMFAYEGGRAETMTLLVANGKARLGWSITDKSAEMNPVGLPPAPPTATAKKSFEAYAASMSPAGRAAMHLMQVAFECPTSNVAKALNKEIISSRVLYETMGESRPTGAQVESLPQEEFQNRVVTGIDVLKSIDETDVSTSVNCGVTQEQVNQWSAQSDLNNPDFVLFMKRMETISQ